MSMRIAAMVLMGCLTMTGAGEQSPLATALNGLAQQQLAARGKLIGAIHDEEAAAKRKAEVRAKILQLVGGLPDYHGPLNAKATRTIPRDGYVIENVLFESLPNYFVTANLYRPAREGRYPAVLMSMGHWDGGKTAGQLIAANLARKGFVVLAYDPVGQGERQQAFDARLVRSLVGGATDQHFTNGAQAILLGQTVARYFIHDGMRAIDYLVSRPEVDAERIGATGCSGGGTQTTYIAALDPRVKVAAPSCYMNSFQTLYAGSVGDSEQSLPNFLAAGLDQTDYVELFAPKPWLMSSTEGDFFTPAGARQVYDEAKLWYKQAGVEDRIKWVVGPGGHGTPLVVREAIYDWMTRWLKNGEGDVKEEHVDLVADRDLLVTKGGQVGGRDLYEIINETPRSKGTPADLKAFTRDLIAANAPLTGRVKLLPQSPGTTRKPAVVLVVPNLTITAEAQQLLDAGNVVALVAPSGAGDDKARPRAGNWLINTKAWLVGRNLPAMHASEIIAAVNIAAGRPDVDATRIRVEASGIPGVWALLAAAADTRISALTLHRTPASFATALATPVSNNLHDAVIPGFALKWDLADLRTLMGNRSVTWTDPTDWLGNVISLDGNFQYTSTDPNLLK